MDKATNIQRILEYDFIKSVCAVVIIVFHFSCHTQYLAFRPLFIYANGSWGGSVVTTFFMVSGALLSANNMNRSIREYYYRRFMAIYPAFYVVYSWFFILKIFQFHTPFYKDNAFYFFSILALDGYVDNSFPHTYYLIGEWFLGAIIICYLVFPFFYKLMQISEPFALSIAVLLFVIALFYPITNPDPYRTIASCMLSMVVGAELQRHSKLIKSFGVLIIAFVLFLILLYIKLPISDNVPMHIMGFCLFIILFNVGSRLVHFSIVKRVVVHVSKLSLVIFLLQHQMIFKFLSSWSPNTIFQSIILLCSIIVSTIVIADIVAIVIKELTNRICNVINKGVSNYENR